MDPESLERVPLSTPPRTPEPLLLRGKEAREVEEGEDPERRYPLIVVTGELGVSFFFAVGGCFLLRRGERGAMTPRSVGRESAGWFGEFWANWSADGEMR